MVGVAITSAVGAYMMKPVLNNIFVEKDEQMLVYIPIAIVILFVMRGMFRFWSIYLATSIGVEITQSIRSEMFKKALNADYATVQSMTVGDLNAHIIQTLLNMRNIIAKTIPAYLVSLLTIVALVVMILYLNWKLSLFAIVLASVIILPIRYLGKKVKSHVLNAEKMISGLSDVINETFRHIDLVKVYNNTSYEQKKFDDVLKRYKKFQLKLSKYKEATSPVMELFVSLAIASVVYFGGVLVIEEGMTVGDFFAFLTALMMLYSPIKVVTKNALVLNILDTYVRRIEKVLRFKQEEKRKKSLKGDISNIAFRNVGLKIGKKRILKNLNFEIKNGETVAIVGKTGAGKSSVLSLLFGFRMPSEGKVLINGEDIETLDINSVRREISYVNQSAGIFNTTIKENIVYGLPFDKDRYENAVKVSHCEFIREMPGKDEYIVGEGGKNLSGGQRQRIALARAIYKDGSLFVLDEATSALDADTENMIQHSLEEIMKKKTTIVIAHRLNTIKNADKVIVMRNGEIVETGSFEEVCKTDAFKKNFALEEYDEDGI
jgi:subfamily B ATP-binding cassette protein MsbA